MQRSGRPGERQNRPRRAGTTTAAPYERGRAIPPKERGATTNCVGAGNAFLLSPKPMPDIAPFSAQDYIKANIRTVPDWPKPGIAFRDITPLLHNPKTLRVLIDLFVHRYMDMKLNYVAGIDARGFILGAIVAYELNLGFIPIRKAGKLPFDTHAEDYALEYGTATVEIHTDSCRPGDRVLILDDLIATGGTMLAAKNLLEKLGAKVVEGAAIVDLPELGGSAKLRAAGLHIHTLCSFQGH